MGIHLNSRLSHWGSVLALVLVAGLICYFGYHSVTEPERFTVAPETFVKHARTWLEKPERERLQAKGMSHEQIEKEIEAMWDRGELKLPEGEPGVDWVARPDSGIQIIPDPEDLLQGEPLPPRPPSHIVLPENAK